MKFKQIWYSALAAAMLLPAGVGQTVAAELQMFTGEQQVLAQTNAQRARYGLPPLAMDPNLMQSARNHCTWMAQNSRLQHSSQMVAENIAQGQSSGTEAVTDWMNSPGHRANILNRGYTRIGVAGYTGTDGRGYWVQQFVQ